MAGLRVGVATVDFTPAAGLPLMGNFRDDYAARGMHDPLKAKAMVFADSGNAKVAILAVDVCMIDRENVAMMRRAIGSECNVRPENVLIHAVHTHSAPATNGRFVFGEDIEPYRPDIEAFLTKAASAVRLADANLVEATLGVGRATEDRLPFNRRLRRKDGATQMNWEALLPGFDPDEIAGVWGPVDPEVVCLTIEREGRPAAAVVNFGLHAAVLAGDNWLYGADFPGALAEALSRTVGGEFTCLFLNGCCGNVNHVDYRDPKQGRGYQAVERIGYMLGAAAHQAVNARVPCQADCVAASSEKVTLARLKIGEAQRNRCRKILDEARANPPQGQVDGLPDAFFAEIRLEMARKQDEPDLAEVMAVRIGDVALVGLPGEIFCEFAMRIKEQSPATFTLVSGLSNDAIGYIPTPESFGQGGYESTVGSTFYEGDAGARLVTSAVAQLNRLFS